MSDILSSAYHWPCEMRKMTLDRDGARPLVGRVMRIGDGYVTGTGTTFRVHILRRERGGYIVYRESLTIWEGARDGYEAALCSTPGDVLRELGGDQMRRAEHDAWEDACGCDEALAAINQIEI